MAKISFLALIFLTYLTFSHLHQIHGAAVKSENSSTNSEDNEKKSVQIKWIVVPESSKEAHDLRSLLSRNEHSEEKKSIFENAVHTIPGLDYIVQKVESAFQGSQPSGPNYIPELGNLGNFGGGGGSGSSLFGSQAVIERPASSGLFGGIGSFIHGLEEKGQNLFSGTNYNQAAPPFDQGYNYGMQPPPQQQQQQQPGLFGFGGSGSQGYSQQQQMGFNPGQSPMGSMGSIGQLGQMGQGQGMGQQSLFGMNQLPVRYPQQQQQPGGSPYMGNLMQPQQYRSFFTNGPNENSPKLRLMSPVPEPAVERERNEKIVKIYRVLPLYNSYYNRAVPVSKEV